MRRVLQAAILGSAFGAMPAAGEILKVTIDVSDMRVVIAFLSTPELAALQRKHGANSDIRDIRQNHRRGSDNLRHQRRKTVRSQENLSALKEPLKRRVLANKFA